MKRIFDIVCSLIILLLFFPFGLIISFLILLESRGGIFYRQERIGRYGKPFRLFKFRSMRKNADKQGKLTVGMRDARITRTGYFIRKFKLDEFPQFINVIATTAVAAAGSPSPPFFLHASPSSSSSLLSSSRSPLPTTMHACLRAR
mgnify:CR=1 FL=1